MSDWKKYRTAPPESFSGGYDRHSKIHPMQDEPSMLARLITRLFRRR